MVYVPAGCEGVDCEVPEPVMVAGPVITQEDETFEVTFTVPGLRYLKITIPEPPFPPLVPFDAAPPPPPPVLATPSLPS